MVTITLDVAPRTTTPTFKPLAQALNEELELLAAEVPSLTVNFITLTGPTGWPLVEFAFAESELGLFADAYGLDVDDLREAVGLA